MGIAQRRGRGREKCLVQGGPAYEHKHWDAIGSPLEPGDLADCIDPFTKDPFLSETPKVSFAYHLSLLATNGR